MAVGAHGLRVNTVSLDGLAPMNPPPYYVDQYEVTNREFQKFVDSGGYER